MVTVCAAEKVPCTGEKIGAAVCCSGELEIPPPHPATKPTQRDAPQRANAWCRTQNAARIFAFNTAYTPPLPRVPASINVSLTALVGKRRRASLGRSSAGGIGGDQELSRVAALGHGVGHIRHHHPSQSPHGEGSYQNTSPASAPFPPMDVWLRCSSLSRAKRSQAANNLDRHAGGPSSLKSGGTSVSP